MVVYTLEQCWEILRYRRCRFWQKKNIFSDEPHFEFGGYVSKQNFCLWGTENPHAYIEKPRQPKQVTVWRGKIVAFFFENDRSKAIVIGPCWTNIYSQKLRRRILATFGFNRMKFCQPRQPFEWNYFPLLTERIVLSNKKRNLRKFSVVFLSIFHKKKVFGGPCITKGSTAAKSNQRRKFKWHWISHMYIGRIE